VLVNKLSSNNKIMDEIHYKKFK